MAHAKEKHLGKNPLFSHDVRMIGGRSVGFMDPGRFSELCEKHKIDETTCNAMFIQITGSNDPHVYVKKRSAIMPLGPKHGYERSKGGTYIGEYHPRNTAHDFRYFPAYEGNMFSIQSDEIHFFAPAKYSQLSAIAVVSPGIRNEDGTLDITEFPDALVSLGADRASVIV